MKTAFENLNDAYGILNVLMSAHTAVYLALLPNKKARELADGRYKDRIKAAQVVYDLAVLAHKADIKMRRAARGLA